MLMVNKAEVGSKSGTKTDSRVSPITFPNFYRVKSAKFSLDLTHSPFELVLFRMEQFSIR